MINKDKIINLVVYLSSKVDDLYITKLLKLIYLIDEISVKESGVKITECEYKVWKRGPVNKELYNSLSFDDRDSIGFNGKIKKEQTKYGQIIKPAATFNDDEFSEYEKEIIDRVILKFGEYKAGKPVKKLHEKDTLWSKIVEEKGLKQFFKTEENTTTPYKIDFSELLKDSPLKRSVYKSIQDSTEFQKTLQ